MVGKVNKVHMQKISFSKQLIKGKVAELIFEQMLRDSGKFTVLNFGYEKVLPELAQRQRTIEAEATMEIIRTAPDYAVINHVSKEVSLVEVKYRTRKSKADVLKQAEHMLESWKTAHLFIATPTGFYSDDVEEIVRRGGEISELKHPHISAELQVKYIKLMMEFMEGVD